MNSLDLKEIKKIKIKILGVGGGGIKIINEIAPLFKKVDFWAIDTDFKLLERADPFLKKFFLGQEITRGLGTGMNVALAKEVALKEKEKLKKIVSSADLVILIACLGGGVGSGASFVLSELIKELNITSYAIFTLPFSFEGKKKMEIALNALKEIIPQINGFSFIPNENIFRVVDKKVPLKKAFSRINQILAHNLSGIINTIYRPGIINIDFADIKTLFRGRSNLVYLAKVEGRGTKEIIDRLINFPLYSYPFKGAKRVIFNLFGPRALSLSQTKEISSFIFEKINPSARIIFGVSLSSSFGVTLLASGCPLPETIFFKKRKSKKRETIKSSRKIQKRKKTRKKSQKTKKKAVLSPSPPLPEKKSITVPVKIRKNGLQIKEEMKEIEEEIRKEEEKWETPAFLRRAFKKRNH